MQEWATQETTGSHFGDTRLNARFAKVVDTLSLQPNESIAYTNESWADTYGAYRFLENDKVTADAILAGHRQSSIERIKQHSVVLIPQDTTFLNMSTDKASKHFGTLRSKESDLPLLHLSIAITPQQVNLGVIDMTLWQRDNNDAMDKKHPDCLPIEEKESYRWIQHYQKACDIQHECQDTIVVSIADREGDIHEWFQYAEERPDNEQAAFLVRAKQNRSLLIEGKEESVLLWDYLSHQQVAKRLLIDVPERKERPARVAAVSLRFAEIEPQGRRPHLYPVRLCAIYAKEKNPPTGEKGIEWMFITNLNITTASQAETMVHWYSSRWTIEVFNHIIKSGCQVEANRFRTDQRRENCIAIYLIIAWRIHTITMKARQDKDEPCTVIFSDEEWTVVWSVFMRKSLPEKPPTVHELTIMLATLGGFLGRKCDGEPGVKSIWRGYSKLLNYIEAINVFGLNKNVYKT